MNNFLITGFGRSGTKFLAKVLNGHSTSWRVEHEPAGGRASLQEVIERFKQNRYGEVNSHLRNWLREIPVKHKAIILRDPEAIAVSVYNRHAGQTPARLEGVWELLHRYAQEDVEVFRFEEFTNNADAIRQIAEWAGIADFELPLDFSPRPVNATRHRLASDYEGIPADVRREIDGGVAWFKRTYYG